MINFPKQRIVMSVTSEMFTEFSNMSLIYDKP